MKNRIQKSCLLFLCIVAGINLVWANECHSCLTFVSASNPNISYMGRISRTYPDSIRFTYPGVSIRTCFSGSSLAMKVKPGSGSFMIKIDDLPEFRINISENDSVIKLAHRLNPNMLHKLDAMYIVEGYELKPAFMGFYLDKEAGIFPVKDTIERKIEFIGNSITCGYGVETDNAEEEFSYATENHYYTYAALTARNLQAQHLVVARSGIGIYRNYGAPRSGSSDCMPQMYEQTLFTDSTEYWNHSLFVPDVVCVNLGTNDVSLGNYDIELLTKGYRNFIKRLRCIYPYSQIVLLSGSMLSGKDLKSVKNAMDTVFDEMREQGDLYLHRFDFSPQDGRLGYGANYHPSRKQHEQMASELTCYLKKLMKW